MAVVLNVADRRDLHRLAREQNTISPPYYNMVLDLHTVLARLGKLPRRVAPHQNLLFAAASKPLHKPSCCHPRNNASRDGTHCPHHRARSHRPYTVLSQTLHRRPNSLAPWVRNRLAPIRQLAVRIGLRHRPVFRHPSLSQ